MRRSSFLAFVTTPALLWSAAAQAHDLTVSYEVESGMDTVFAVFVKLKGYPGENRRLVAGCDSLFIHDDGTNPYISDLDCDTRIISTSVADHGVVVTLGDNTHAQFALEPGAHILNGLPFEILPEPPAIPTTPTKSKSKS